MESKSPVNRSQSGKALKHEAEEVSRLKRIDYGNEACYFGARRRLQHLDVVFAKTWKPRFATLRSWQALSSSDNVYIYPVVYNQRLYNYPHSTKLYRKISRVCCRLYCYECAARVTMPMATNELTASNHLRKSTLEHLKKAYFELKQKTD